MAVNLINVNVNKIRKNFGKVRLLGARFEQPKFFKYSTNFYDNFELINYYQILLTIYILANRNSPQSQPMRVQVPNFLRLGIEIPLGLPELFPNRKWHFRQYPHMRTTIICRVILTRRCRVFERWANVTHFMRGSIG